MQRAVGSVVEIDRPKPVVGRRNKLSFFVGSFGRKGDSLRRESLAVDQIAGDFGDEGVAIVFRRISSAAIDGDAAGRSEETFGSGFAARIILPCLGSPPFGTNFSPRLGRAAAVDG